jgi:2-methylisocitrate lyase-like PEP mutase family enzyme
MNVYETFLQLHQQPAPLLLGNIWDVNSARVFERNGYKAIATSSAALANTFGYEDGEQLPFDDILRLAKKVVQEVKIPFSVDIEGGYGRTFKGIAENIEKLHDVGVAGINLEDTIPSSPRQLQTLPDFTAILSGVNDYLSKKNIKIFLNIRTDGFLLGLPSALEETVKRINIYEECGVQGIFTPCIVNTSDIRTVVQTTKLPVNVMNMPALPSFSALAQLGVKRISMGNSVHQFVTAALDKKIQSIIEHQSF